MPQASQLNERQRQFVREYLIDLSRTQAAIRAGYSPHSAKSIAKELMRNPKVKAEIDRAMGERLERLQIQQDWVLAKLVANLEHAMSAEPYQGAVANKALELIGKHAGMFSERLELTGKDGADLQVVTIPLDDLAKARDVLREAGVSDAAEVDAVHPAHPDTAADRLPGA